MTWLGSSMSTRPAAPLPVATQRAATTGRAVAADAVRLAPASEEEVLDDDLGCSLLVLVGLDGMRVSVWLVPSTVLLLVAEVAALMAAVPPGMAGAGALLLAAKSSVGRTRAGLVTLVGSPAGALST